MDTVSTFSVAFPLPYRVLSLFGLGALLWTLNLHILGILGIDPAHVLQIRQDKETLPLPSPYLGLTPTSPNSTRSQSIHPPLYKTNILYAAWVFIGLAMYHILTAGDVETLDEWKIVPIITYLGVLCIVLLPLNSLQRSQRSILVSSLIRCVSSTRHQPVYFTDVLMADILTSFAKVIGDVWISIILLAPGGSLSDAPKAEGISEYVVPVLMSVPYLIRFRQCVVEYIGSSGTSRRPLYNAIKYATAFPVIFLSAAQRYVDEAVSDTLASADPLVDTVPTTWRGEYTLFRLWFLAVIVNSVYSFWWDTTNDWGLTLFRRANESPPPQNIYQTIPHSAHESSTNLPLTPTTSVTPSPTSHSRKPSSLSQVPRSPSPSHSHSSHSHSTRSYPFGLRPILLYQDPVIYYGAIILNGILRFTWSLKLSSHLHTVAELESGVFLMEALELVRRWMWVFFRVEWEAVKEIEAKGGYDRVIDTVDGEVELTRLRKGDEEFIVENLPVVASA